MDRRAPQRGARADRRADDLHRHGGGAHEWASTAQTYKSYELLARYVAPHFQGQLQPIEDNRAWFESNLRTIFDKSPDASVKAFTDAGKEVPEELTKQIEEGTKRREEREQVTREAQAAAADGGEGGSAWRAGSNQAQAPGP